jgi:hypothetical protein
VTAIYHITHIRNLPGILAEGGLWCDAEAERRGLAHQVVGHAHIKERRKWKQVTCGPRGVLADYVPFYFAPRSPMLYSIHTGFVQGYDGTQEEILHLVSSAEGIRDAGLRFVFTDGHAPMALSKQFDDLAHLDKVDWSVMPLTWWNDTPEFPDRKRKRQAEFLVRRFVPFERITAIGVCTNGTAGAARGELVGRNGAPVVSVHRDWYY